MHRRERHVEEERGGAARLDPADGLGGDQVGHVPRLLNERFVAMPGPAERTLLVTMVPRADPTGERSVGMIEAEVIGTLRRQRAEMPLPRQAGVVADALEGARQGDRVPG